MSNFVIKFLMGTCPYCGGTDYMCGCTPDNHGELKHVPY